MCYNILECQELLNHLFFLAQMKEVFIATQWSHLHMGDPVMRGTGKEPVNSQRLVS